MPLNNLAYHTAGVPFQPRSRGSCLDPVFTKGCANKKAGFVTLHLHTTKPSISCLHAGPGKVGICWPGGQSGYNLNDFLNG